MDRVEYPRPEVRASHAPRPSDRPWGAGMVALPVFEILAQANLVPGAWVSYGTSFRQGSLPLEGPEAFRATLVDALLYAGSVLLILSAIQLAAGIGVVKGRRWGFVVGAIASGLLLLPYLAIASTPFGLFFFVADAALLVHVWQRLRGRSGPRAP